LHYTSFSSSLLVLPIYLVKLVKAIPDVTGA